MAELKRRRMMLADMKPAEHNPRKDLQPGDREWEKIERSLDTFGMLEPIIYNERSGHIVGGHQRAKIMAHKGETEADVVLVDLSDEDEKILCAKLNRVQGYWDTAKLSELLMEIKEATGSLINTGFEDWELESLTRAYDHIGDLMAEEFSDFGKSEQTSFAVTFTFPISAKESMNAYISDKGKKGLQELVLERIQGGDEE